MDSIGSILIHFILSLLLIFAIIFMSRLLFRAMYRYIERRRERDPQHLRRPQEQRRDTAPANQSSMPEPSAARGFDYLFPNTPWLSKQVLRKGIFYRITVRGCYHKNDLNVDAVYTWKPDGPPACFVPHCGFFIDDHKQPARPFREKRRFSEYEFAYLGKDEQLVLFLDLRRFSLKSFSEHDSWLTVSITGLPIKEVREAGLSPVSDQAEKPNPAELEAIARSEAEEAAVKQRLEFTARIDKLSHQFANPSYADDAWIKQYAKKYRADLLARKSEIVASHAQFHADTEFINFLKETAPDVYQRATWQTRALHVAEQLDVEEPPKRTVPTPEQVRARMLSRIAMKATDNMARAKLITTMAAEYRKELENLGLDEDEIDEKVATFVETLTADAEAANHPGTGTIA